MSPHGRTCPKCKVLYPPPRVYRFCPFDGTPLKEATDGHVLADGFLKAYGAKVTDILKGSKVNAVSLTVEDGGEVLRHSPGFSVEFQRTLRIPDDGRRYPLPPGLGRFPIRRVIDYYHKVPSSWQIRQDSVFIPMHQREAMWIRFRVEDEGRYAVKVGSGNINAISGGPFAEAMLPQEQQDYVVCPPQEWLEGVKTGNGTVRQFVATPLASGGHNLEYQIRGCESVGGIQIIVFAGKREEPPANEDWEWMTLKSAIIPSNDFEMGLAGGGKMRQKIYPDPHGHDSWDRKSVGGIFVHIVNSHAYKQITGEDPPPSPITAKTYTENGLPWFDVYDEKVPDIRVSERLYSFNSVRTADKIKGLLFQQDDSSVDIHESLIKQLQLKPAAPDNNPAATNGEEKKTIADLLFAKTQPANPQWKFTTKEGKNT